MTDLQSRKEVIMMAPMNGHAQQRSAQRNVSSGETEYVVRHGKLSRRGGARIHFLRRCDPPHDDRINDERTRLVGTAVILSSDRRSVLTLWRNRRDGLRRIKRKPKYRFRSCRQWRS
jgi:hypothetical protein